MLPTQEKVIGGKTYSVTALPARRALALLPLSLKRRSELGPAEMVAFAQGLLDGSCKVDGEDLWPKVDDLFHGNLATLLLVLDFAEEVNFGFERAAKEAEANRSAT